MDFQSFSVADIHKRILLDNPWWADSGQIDAFYRRFLPRPYLKLLFPLITDRRLNRAVVLMGPRRVGKTVMLNHAIQQLIQSGVPAKSILYTSIDTPIYTKLPLEKILQLALETAENTAQFHFCFFDEIQYLKDWEVHLKSLVDTYKNVKFVVSGSAAAALRLKSIESGAGRFTDFTLPPLSFHEYLELSGTDRKFTIQRKKDGFYTVPQSEMPQFNKAFVEYISYGGYPELLDAEVTQGNIERYIKADIIDKVLLKDLPGLYGIQDIQELNSLFTSLAYNTGKETSLDTLSKNSGVAKNTIKRYIEYLEASFLIKIFRRIDFNSKVFRRDNFFKIYLVNSSMRSALFSPLDAADDSFGHLVETAIFSQWFHSEHQRKYYARWKDGEVDLVYLEPRMKPKWAVEIKWSNRAWEQPSEIEGFISYCSHNHISKPTVTTRDKRGQKHRDHMTIDFIPAALYCYTVGRNIIESKFLNSSPLTDG